MLLAGLQALGHSSSAGEDFFAQAMARLNAGRVNNAVFRTDGRPVDELYTRQINALEPITELAWPIPSQWTIRFRGSPDVFSS
jgi:hypothetical protein